MITLLQIILITVFTYIITTFIGLGLISFIFKQDVIEEKLLFAPWFGFLWIGLISAWFNLFRLGTQISYPFVLLGGLSFWFASKQKIEWTKICFIGLLAVIASLILSLPILIHSEGLTTISTGNHDAYFYALASEELRAHGNLLSTIKTYQSQPPIPIDYTKEVLSQMLVQVGFNPRWMPIFNLSFFSALFHSDSANLFSILNNITLILSWPLLYFFITRTLQLSGWVSKLALLFCLINPHILYILYHDFFPQIMGMGFAILYISLLPLILENKNIHWFRSSIILGLPLTGVLMSYLDLIPALILLTFLTLAYQYIQEKFSIQKVIKMALGCALLILFLAPYQTYQFFYYLWEAQLSGAAKYGWDVTKRYYLFLLPLGSYFTHPSPQPNIFLEWLLAPLLCYLAFLGIRNNARGGYFFILIIPFVLSGFLSYLRDYNYAYFKNFTYVYFWLPIAVVQGTGIVIERMKQNNGIKKLIAIFTVSILFLIMIQASIKAGERISYASRKSKLITKNLKSLQSIGNSPDVDHIFVDETLSFWETLWSLYYLRDKKRSYESFEFDHNPAGSNKFKYLLKKKGVCALTHPLGDSTNTKKIYENNDYDLIEYKDPQLIQQPQIRLGEGFSPRESNGLDQWVWMGEKECKLLLRSSTEIPGLTLELYSLDSQNIQISIHDQIAYEINLTGNTRKNYTIIFSNPLLAGTHEIKLIAEKPYSTKGEENIMIFRIL